MLTVISDGEQSMKHLLRRCFPGGQAGFLYFVLGIGAVANAGGQAPLPILGPQQVEIADLVSQFLAEKDLD
ncbi:hypothetical protein D3C78_1897270 [compost metagenome]